MKSMILLLTLTTALSVSAQSVFIPENGSYVYDRSEVANLLSNYVKLRNYNYGSDFQFKLDKKRNEFVARNWFQRDWFLMQDMFSFDQNFFIQGQKAATFNEAKRKQYARFAFDKKGYFHRKTTPAMKEWGGLTHPPIKKLSLPLEKYDSNFAPKNYSVMSSPYFSPELQHEIDIVSKSELTFGNTVQALADRNAFLKKKELISRARDSILMSSLVFVCDKGTKEIVNLLIKKHREGVDVKILVDGFIGKLLGHRECLKTMRNAGIEVFETKDFFKHKLKAIYHTKTLVTDLKEAVAGGHNMIDADNLSRGVDFQNRDIDLYINGPMVSDIAKQFVDNWEYQTTLNKKYSPLHHYNAQILAQRKIERSAGKRGSKMYASILSNPATRMKGVCRFIKQAPYEDRHTIGKAYLKLLDKVSSHLVIHDPIKSETYVEKRTDAPVAEMMDNFEMYNKLHLKVQALARKGKKIDFITTNINMAGNENVAIMNERIKDQLNEGKELLANWSLAKLIASNNYYGKPHYKNLIKDWMPFKNVHVWKHISFMHSKIFYFDRIVASVGSYNFQHNATDHAYESTTICMDETLNRELDTIAVEDMVNAVPLIFSELR